MNKGKLTWPLRRLGLMHALDIWKFLWQKLQNRTENRAFKREHPEVALPPDYLMFESFKLHYASYYDGGRATAKWLLDQFTAYTSLSGKYVLDWGCGPGRIIRHLPSFLPETAQVFGTDYNPRSIAWCSRNLPGIAFSLNQLDPPLGYSEGQMDIAYGISIFTHLSAVKHRAWMAELARVIKPGGFLLLTTQGEAFRPKLTEQERQQFDAQNVVVRGQVKEGHRVFVAFQPPSFFAALAAPYFKVVAFTPGKPESWGISQDTWVFQRNMENGHGES